MACVNQIEAEEQVAHADSGASWRRLAWPGWVPLLALPAATIAVRAKLAPWCFMWMLAFAIFFGCKWQTWWDAYRRISALAIDRTLGYLLAWPGMDAEAFLDLGQRACRPKIGEWMQATAKTVLGAELVWGVSRHGFKGHNLLAGWLGMLGVVLLLQFGMFHILSLGWRSAGVQALPLMQAPLYTTSLSEFWGRRWNLGFRQLTHDLIFRPVRMRGGLAPAILLSFLASGVVHDLVISLPARGGYGLPTAYFVLQGFGVLFERSPLGRRIGLGSGVRGWLFFAICAGGPVFILFHPFFVGRVIVPFLEVIGGR